MENLFGQNTTLNLLTLKVKLLMIIFVLGYLLYFELPDGLTIGGSAIIVVAMSVIAATERKR